MTQLLKFKRSPTTSLSRLQGMAALITLGLLILLPLEPGVKLSLCGLLGLYVVMLWRRRWAYPDIDNLLIDIVEQKISAGLLSAPLPSTRLSSAGLPNSEPSEERLSCRVKYVSHWLVMLAYPTPESYRQRCCYLPRYFFRYSQLPIFPGMLGQEDFGRLLAVARSMARL